MNDKKQEETVSTSFRDIEKVKILSDLDLNSININDRKELLNDAIENLDADIRNKYKENKKRMAIATFIFLILFILIIVGIAVFLALIIKQ
ncbi:hypothetical protein LAD74_02955 [Mycoplasma sp. U97]|uniref:Uncharacterized protein n=1 Tax=Mycoplasma tauri TaxID=547987 RepID=A0A953ND21_9MOLU|nr:hypothetical protein [Mycoplasma tauri]MBZ4195621.1 hypothetical protein [Mycoplasma tauri]MBZ4212927.1 hypothetical protein [Mycoplasma tauri]QSB07683.1 hypothetical protein JS510_00990 [Mycoplasma tauri]